MKKLMLLLMVVLLVGTVSAIDWDNKLTYSNEDLKVDFENLWGLPLIGSYLGSAELKSHPSVDYIKKVGAGNSIVMWYDFDFIDLYGNGLGEVKFTDQRTGGEIDRDYSYVYWGDKERDVYGQGKCYLNINGTEFCETVVIGTETYQDWIPYNSKDIPQGKVRIGIKVEVRVNDYVDGIWEIVGKKVSRHAVWTASLETDLESFFKLDDNNANVTIGDELSNHTGILNVDSNTLSIANGKINRAINFTSASNFINLTNRPFYTGDTISVGGWFNLNTNNSFDRLISKDLTGSDRDFLLASQGSAAGVIWGIWNAGGTQKTINSNTEFEVGVWYFVVGVYNSTHLIIYINGTNVGEIAQTGDIRDGAGTSLEFGRRQDGAEYLDGVIDEWFIYDRALNDSEVLQYYNDGFGCSFQECITPITITLNSPVDTFNTINQTINFNGSVVSVGTLANVSLIIDGIFNETNSSRINNVDYLFTKTISDGIHNWTYEVCDDFTCTNTTVRTFTISRFIENSQTFNASSFETAEETFTINITTNGAVPTNGKLIYNGTTFPSTTITNIGGNDYNISKTIDIPLVNGTKSWFFNITIGGTEFNSSTQNQIINSTDFVFCKDTAATYFNVSFKNETLAEEATTAQINADWSFWLGGGTTFKTLNHLNATENIGYSFCLESTDNRTLQTNVSIVYDNSISQQRSFFKEYTLTNISTNQTLFLLPTTDGIFVTFQTVTVAEQIISGVSANATKSGDLIESGTTDDAGLVTFFLDPDTTYIFNFFKTGFDLVTTSLKPTQTSFTITMGSEVIQEENDTTKGINYKINPISSVLNNNTETEFNLTLTSSFWGLDSFGFALKNSTGDVFNITTSTTGTGGFLSRQLNTGDNNDIVMEIFWTINGNQTNITRIWLVIDDSDEGFSIKTFFDDLATYLTSNMFGLTNFGLGIIIFGIILLVTGILAAKFGNIITNPPGISLIIFSLVLFFDVGLGIMPNPVGAVNNFPTIFMGLIFLGVLLREGIK